MPCLEQSGLECVLARMPSGEPVVGIAITTRINDPAKLNGGRKEKKKRKKDRKEVCVCVCVCVCVLSLIHI